MKQIFCRFKSEKRGAIAVIFALTLVPLVLIVALTIDFSFFTEARSQIQLAADAAATHAVRAATGTYALETSQGTATATAQADAITAGNNAGAAWFQAQLGQLPTANVPASFKGTADPYVNTQATTNPSGFSTAVQYEGLYPPFFNHLFHATQNWIVAGTSGAASQYSYVEIMMVLDTSQSMDIGADPIDIQTMNDDSVCIPNGDINNTGDFTALNTGGYQPYYPDPSTTPTITNTAADIAANVDFSNNHVAFYINPTNSPTNTSGTCDSTKNNNSYVYGTPLAPCALACHTSNTLANGFYGDLYGMARRDGVNLRIDEVFAATENVISTMIATEQASDQYSIGVYQFNDDISVLAAGTQGTPGDGAGDTTYEATYNLNGVLQGVRSIDYKVTPAETSFPPLTNSGETVDDTNFPLSVAHFVAGNATGGTPLGAVNVATEGDTANNPIKDVFIVTDGMEDSSPNVGRSMGEMTGVASENGQTSNAICQKFKNLGYTVYVLYISYYPLPNYFYAVNASGTPATAATATDYPTFATTALVQGYAEGGSEVNQALGNAATEAVPPDEAALEACASMPSDLYVASNSATINSQLSLILKSALSSAIRITQ